MSELPPPKPLPPLDMAFFADLGAAAAEHAPMNIGAVEHLFGGEDTVNAVLMWYSKADILWAFVEDNPILAERLAVAVRSETATSLRGLSVEALTYGGRTYWLIAEGGEWDIVFNSRVAMPQFDFRYPGHGTRLIDGERVYSPIVFCADDFAGEEPDEVFQRLLELHERREDLPEGVHVFEAHDEEVP